MHSVTEQSELEFIEQAIVESLQDTDHLTEEQLLQQAMQQSLVYVYAVYSTARCMTRKKTDKLIMASPHLGFSRAEDLDDDTQLRMAMELSEMSEEEVLRRVLEESTRQQRASREDDEDPELLAAIARSMASP